MRFQQIIRILWLCLQLSLIPSSHQEHVSAQLHPHRISSRQNFTSEFNNQRREFIIRTTNASFLAEISRRNIADRNSTTEKLYHFPAPDENSNNNKSLIVKTENATVKKSNKKRKHRNLTPIDLTKEFIFDDAEEIATSNYNSSELEKMMLDVDNIFTSKHILHSNNTNLTSSTIKPGSVDFLSQGNITQADATNGQSVNRTKPTVFQSIKTKIDEGLSYFGGIVLKPIQIFGKVINPKTTIAPNISTTNFGLAQLAANQTRLNKTTIKPVQSLPRRNSQRTTKPTTNSPNRIIFPDNEDDDFSAATVQIKRDVNASSQIIFSTESVSTTLPVPICKSNEILYQFKCEVLLTEGPCGHGKLLVQNETGHVSCENNLCTKFPRFIFYNGRCVMQYYYAGCPAGMHLILERTGKGECDCKPGFIYSTQHDKCYEAYTQGPCRHSEYFILQDGGQPTCVRNPCRRNGLICFGPNCSALENCVHLQSFCENGDGIVMVNEKSLKPECRNMMSSFQDSVDDRVLGNVGQFRCSPGTKRDLTGNCRKVITFTFS